MKEKLQSLTRKQKMVIMVCTGAAILILLWPRQESEESLNPANTVTNATEQSEDTLQSYVNYQEKKLKAIVEKIHGAGKVYVMITAKASREMVVEKDVQSSVEKNNEADSSGGTRNVENKSSQEATVMYGDSLGGSTPYVVKSLEPEIEGVVVAAQGAADASVAAEIVNTVNVLFDVPAHKVKVVQME